MACTSLCLWARAIYKYNDVAQTIAPKKAKLAEAEAGLASAQKVLGEKRAALAAVVAKVAQLKAQYTASLAKKEELAKSQKTTAARLERAVKLTGGLADEAVRWKAAATQLELDMVNLVGNMLVSSSCIAYLGAFTSGFRADLVSTWVGVAKELSVPVDGAFSLVRLLADP
jgi:dynein heavy chain